MTPATWTAPGSGKSRRLSALLVFAFILLLVALSWRYFLSFQWALFFETLSDLDHKWVLAGAAIALASYWIRAVRWKLMMLPAPSRLRTVFSATLIGFVCVVLLGRAGELVRPVLIARQERSTVAAQCAVWLLERLYDLLLILLLFGIGLAQAGSLRLPAQSTLLPILRVGGGLVTLVAGATSGALYVLARHPELCRARILRAVGFLPESVVTRITSTVDSFLEGARSIRQPKILIASLFLTVLEWAAILAAIWCYFQAHPESHDLRLLDVAVYLGFVAVGNIIQVPGIGGGIQIASLVVLTELFHLPVEVATGLSLLVWAGSALIVLPFGVPLAIVSHVKLSEFRQNRQKLITLQIQREAP